MGGGGGMVANLVLCQDAEHQMVVMYSLQRMEVYVANIEEHTYLGF